MINMPISASARQHLVDAKHAEGVHTDSEMERVFASRFCYIFVGTDTRCFKRFAGELLIFIRDKVATEWELIDRSTLPAEIKDTNLVSNGVRNPVASTILTTSAPWSQGHHDCTSTWDRAYSCNNGSNEQDGDPF